MSHPAPYIEYRNVSVDYPRHVRGLDGVSLGIERGEFVFFVGKTGAGKSTLLKLLTLESRATAGEVIWDGRAITRVRAREVHRLRRQMGIIPQDFALLPRKKVWENLAYAMRAIGHSRRESRRRVMDVLEQVNIGHRADAFPHQLSGGEQQRVAIGRALLNNPALLIADEPTGNLDPEHSWEIMELLRRLNLRGTTVLVASHDMLVVERMSTRIVELENGRIPPPFASWREEGAGGGEQALASWREEGAGGGEQDLASWREEGAGGGEQALASWREEGAGGGEQDLASWREEGAGGGEQDLASWREEGEKPND
jgi:cell division transport system ATP-binding protein